MKKKKNEVPIEMEKRLQDAHDKDFVDNLNTLVKGSKAADDVKLSAVHQAYKQLSKDLLEIDDFLNDFMQDIKTNTPAEGKISKR